VRTLAIGDIHGCLRALDSLLQEVDLQRDDRIVTLGDYIDRGPNSKGVLDRIIELQGRCFLSPLRGNHDLMMHSARDGPDRFAEWLKMGGAQTLTSYGAKESLESFAEAIPTRHWSFLEDECLPFLETDTHLFVHANLSPDLALADQPEYLLYWESLDAAIWRPHESGKTVVCGHTAQRSGRPLLLDRAVCIDTWVYGEGWLTCLDVELEVYWQANERGQTRMGNLGFRSR
jgi:serine/threonine protein phosphatase 1